MSNLLLPKLNLIKLIIPIESFLVNIKIIQYNFYPPFWIFNIFFINIENVRILYSKSLNKLFNIVIHRSHLRSLNQLHLISPAIVDLHSPASNIANTQNPEANIVCHKRGEGSSDSFAYLELANVQMTSNYILASSDIGKVFQLASSGQLSQANPYFS